MGVSHLKEAIIQIIEKVKTKITDASDMAWVSNDSPKALRDQLDIYLEKINQNDWTSLEELRVHFLPTCTFQEHSISNGWGDEYLRLAEKFDEIYKNYKENNQIAPN